MEDKRKKGLLVTITTGSVLCLIYLTPPAMRYQHAIYRMLFYFPLVPGSFWFGLKGALCISASTFIFYVPYLVTRWEGYSYRDFTSLLEMVLYMTIALVLGLLAERERKRQRALVQTERLAAIGKTVSELAHDMKTPLIAIHGFASQISSKLQDGNPDKGKLDMMIRETVRLESMVKEMLDFGRPFELHPIETNLNDLVRQSINVAEVMGGKAGVLLKDELDPSLPLLHLDPYRFRQVLLNLISNAIQASPAGESVIVRTRLDGKEAVLDIIDRGHGISEKDPELLFSPFFSTKRGGSGLGLAIVKKVITAHDGRVSFYSNQEKGVTFTLSIPLNKKRS